MLSTHVDTPHSCTPCYAINSCGHSHTCTPYYAINSYGHSPHVYTMLYNVLTQTPPHTGNSDYLPRGKPATTESCYPAFGACWVFLSVLEYRRTGNLSQTGLEPCGFVIVSVCLDSEHYSYTARGPRDRLTWCVSVTR